MCAKKDVKATRPVIFMCPPDLYSVEYVINPWMSGNVHRSNTAKARRQWKALHKELAERAAIETIVPKPGVPDLVFTANAGLVLEDTAIISHFRHPERQKEEPHFRRWFQERGYKVIEMPRGMFFEGAGDGLFLRGTDTLFMGYGFRTVLDAAEFVSDTMRIEVIPLRLIDERFYHLDTCFCPLKGGYVFYYPGAFDERSNRLIEKRIPAAKRYAVSERDAMHFACNAVDTETAVVLNNATSQLEQKLREWGFDVVKTPLTQFLLAGGAAKCLTLRLDEQRVGKEKRRATKPVVVSRSIEFRGHFIDNGTLTRVMDLVPAIGGTFKVLDFTPGLTKEDVSHLVMQINAPDREHLQGIMLQLLTLGGRQLEMEEIPAQLATVEQDGTAPDHFYATTVFAVDVYTNGNWRRAKNHRRDCAIVVPGKGEPECRRLRNLKKGDQVVVGADGIRIEGANRHIDELPENLLPGADLQGVNRLEPMVDFLSWEMRRIKDRKGKLAVIPSQMLLRQGGSAMLSTLFQRGYIHALLCGNTFAANDLELALYGTVEGIDPKRGAAQAELSHHGLRAVNRIRKAGGLASAVKRSLLKRGVLYECTRGNLPLAIVGTVADENPLPETIMDADTAQEKYHSLLKDADMIVLLATGAEALAAARFAGPDATVVCVDADREAANAIRQRGPSQFLHVAADAMSFLAQITARLSDED